MLVQIVNIDNKCNIYRALKIKNRKYPIRIYQVLDKLKYKNAKYIYRWYLIESQTEEELTLKLGRFLIEECLDK